MKTLFGLIAFATGTLAAGIGLSGYSPAARLLIATPDQEKTITRNTEGKQHFSAGLQEQNVASYNPDSVQALLDFAHTFMGLEYKYGGATPAGFDCSGFTNYVYGEFGYEVPHGSSNQAVTGEQIAEQEAQKGDLLIFTGTNLSDRTPGHVGIVISEKGEPIRFIHSSSNGGVKISEVTGTRYADRLLQIRRIL